MEKAKKSLELISEEESNLVTRLAVPAHRVGSGFSSYEDFALKGIRVDRVEPGLVVCSFKVPPRLTVSPPNRFDAVREHQNWFFSLRLMKVVG